MNIAAFILFGIGFLILMCKRSILDFICGIQICTLGVLSFLVTGGESSYGLGFIILICSGLFAAVGVSVLVKSGISSGDTRGTK